MSVFRVEKNKNYTVLSNYHLKDKNLSLRAIGLLSVILSLPENWNYTQAGLATIVKDGLSSVSAGLNELEQYGYLVRTRERDLNGRLGNAIYTVYEMPTMNPKSSNVIHKSELPELENPTLENPMQGNVKHGNPVLEKDTQLITKKNNKTKNTTKNKTNTQSQRMVEERAAIINKIKNNVGYEFFVYKNQISEAQLNDSKISLEEYDNIDRTYNLKTVSKIIEYMADVFISQGNSELRIGDDVIDREVVKQKLMTIGLSEMKQVVFALNSTVIKNPRKYAISMLYNL